MNSRMLSKIKVVNFDSKTGYTFNKLKLSLPCNLAQANLHTNTKPNTFSYTTEKFPFVPSCTEDAVNKESKNYLPFLYVFHMQTSDLNVNNTESYHATAIFRQFQDAIFSREHTSVKTLTKIIFDLLQWQEIATLSLTKKKSCHHLFHLNNISPAFLPRSQ